MSNFRKTGHLSYYCKNQNGFNNAVKDCWNTLYWDREISTKDEIYEVLHPSYLGENWPKFYPAIVSFTPFYTGRDSLSVSWRKANLIDKVMSLI